MKFALEMFMILVGWAILMTMWVCSDYINTPVYGIIVLTCYFICVILYRKLNRKKDD